MWGAPNAIEAAAAHTDISGLENFDSVVDIDQSPIGRTPRSNPATYTGAFTPIRDWYAALPELLAQPGVDAIYVATPNHLHRQAVEAAAAELQAVPVVDLEDQAGVVVQAAMLSEHAAVVRERDGVVDPAGVEPGVQRIPAEAELFHRAGPVILDQHVGLGE